MKKWSPCVIGMWLVMIFAAFIAVSCKKSSGSGTANGNSSGYYMRFKLDGTQTEYNSQPVGGITVNGAGTVYTAVLVAYKDVNAGLKNEITITLINNTPVKAGVAYNDPSKATQANGDKVAQTTVFYYDPGAIGYLTVGMFADAAGNIPIAGLVADAKLTFTEMTTTYLKGTFSGTVFNSADLKQSHLITAGEFYLQRTN